MANDGKEEVTAVTEGKASGKPVVQNQTDNQQQVVSFAMDVTPANHQSLTDCVKYEKAAFTEGKESGTLVEEKQADKQQQSVSLALDVSASNQLRLVDSVKYEMPVSAEEGIEDGKFLHLQTFLRSTWNGETQGTSNHLSKGMKAYRYTKLRHTKSFHQLFTCFSYIL